MDAVKKGEADVAVSAGNTGALMAMARFNLKMAPGISRPALAALWPTLRGESVVLDVGASIGADASHLIDLAIMGGAMARVLFDLDRPTVGLLNIGVEEVKGLEPVRDAGRILREMNLPDIDYIGFVEGHDIGLGSTDVVVTEGFAGYRAQAAEGTAKQMATHLRNANPQRCARASAIWRKGGSAPRATRWIAQSQRWRASWPQRSCDQSAGTIAGFATAVDMGYDMARYELLAKINGSANAHATIIKRRWWVEPRRERDPGQICCCGSYLPARVLTNNDLARMVDTSDGSPSVPEFANATSRPTANDVDLRRRARALADAKVDVDRSHRAHSRLTTRFRRPQQAQLGITTVQPSTCRRSARGLSMRWQRSTGHAHGRIPARAGDGGDLFAYSRLEGSRHLRVVGDGAGAFVVEAVAQQGTYADRGLLATRCARTAVTRPSSTWTAGPRRPARWERCGWKAGPSSSTPSP
jgi:glycerol-3-phosphate acyltransferase PlsX